MSAICSFSNGEDVLSSLLQAQKSGVQPSSSILTSIIATVLNPRFALPLNAKTITALSDLSVDWFGQPQLRGLWGGRSDQDFTQLTKVALRELYVSKNVEDYRNELATLCQCSPRQALSLIASFPLSTTSRELALATLVKNPELMVRQDVDLPSVQEIQGFRRVSSDDWRSEPGEIVSLWSKFASESNLATVSSGNLAKLAVSFHLKFTGQPETLFNSILENPNPSVAQAPLQALSEAWSRQDAVGASKALSEAIAKGRIGARCRDYCPR